jgi:hypothetical protein
MGKMYIIFIEHCMKGDSCEMRGFKIPRGFNLPYRRGGQFSIRGVNIPWMKIDPGVNLPQGSKYYMTPGFADDY